MKILLGIVIGVVLIILAGFMLLDDREEFKVATSTPQALIPATQTDEKPVKVTPVTHATIILEWANTVIYTDPTSTSTVFRGKIPDIILITDIHSDHLSTSTLRAVMASSTIIVPQAVENMLSDDISARTLVLKNGESTTTAGFKILAVPMYNFPETADSLHSKGRGNGYIIERDGYRVYIAGDTSGTPELKALTNIDMAFIPMNLPFTMSVEEAAEAVIAFKPKQVYPYHYRGQNGLSDVNKFKQLVDAANIDTEVLLLNWYPPL